MTAGVEISLYITCMHGVNTGLRGPAAIGHMVFFGPVRPTWYIFPICWGSEVGLWVMTARVEILLYMGYLHGINTCLRGPASIGDIVFFGPVRPLDTHFLYIWGRRWVGG